MFLRQLVTIALLGVLITANVSAMSWLVLNESDLDRFIGDLRQVSEKLKAPLLEGDDLKLFQAMNYLTLRSFRVGKLQKYANEMREEASDWSGRFPLARRCLEEMSQVWGIPLGEVGLTGPELQRLSWTAKLNLWKQVEKTVRRIDPARVIEAAQVVDKMFPWVQPYVTQR